MAVQDKFNSLKQGPKENKVAVASGSAIFVIAILLIGWGIYFLHSIQNGSRQLYIGGGTQQQFNPDTVTQAQQQLQQEFGSTTQDLQNIQQESQDSNAGGVQTQPMQTDGAQSDLFGTPNSSYSQ
jgi:uncharacterized protein HemX